MASASIQHPMGRRATAYAVAYGEWVCRTQPTSGLSAYMEESMATTAPWMGGSPPSSKVPSRPTRTTAEAGWPCSEEPAVKYISAAPGTRTLTLPCPFAELPRWPPPAARYRRPDRPDPCPSPASSGAQRLTFQLTPGPTTAGSSRAASVVTGTPPAPGSLGCQVRWRQGRRQRTDHGD